MRGPLAAPGVGRLTLLGYVTFGLLNLAVGVFDLVTGNPWGIFPAGTVGLAFLVMWRHLKLMYRLGWQWGRRELIWSTEEAQMRGLSPREWLIAEIERTEQGAFTITNREDDQQ